MIKKEGITKVPGVLGGKPTIKGHRIAVDHILTYVVNGLGIKEIKRDYPHLKDAEIKAALDYGERSIYSVRTSFDAETV